MDKIEQITMAEQMSRHSGEIKIGVATAGATASVMTLNEWVALATLVFVLLQIGLLIPKYYIGIKTWLSGKK